MDIINGAVLPRCHAAPVTGAAAASVADARVSGHLQLLRRVRCRGSGSASAGLLHATTPRAGVAARRFFSPPLGNGNGNGRTIGWRPARCTHGGSSSDGDGAAAADFDAREEEFVDSSVMEAVELRSVSDGGFVIKMRDGRNLRCVQNNPRVLRLRDSAPHHAIVLKMEDGSDLLLPIIVSTYQFPACCLDECLIDVINRCCRCFFFLLLVLNLVACSCYFNHIPPQWRRQASCFWLRFGTSEFQGQPSTMWCWR
ncbi:Bifunctional nuclease 1 [Zea mays]|uniref:Bifunctional nuclease 1 n=1 Tax=Zea mays TaxID=4577 RepID=B8A1Y4_MAIZE|nr:unknown [Zea mays]ONM32867.1 Bifunctional nuclease 1 [Zea mays]|eukprot:NP_001146511.1 uncharacterized protein LOC100280101 [Zea mays]